MQIEPLNFEQLKKAKETHSDLTYQGFVLNVYKSFEAALIDKDQMDFLLA